MTLELYAEGTSHFFGPSFTCDGYTGFSPTSHRRAVRSWPIDLKWANSRRSSSSARAGSAADEVPRLAGVGVQVVQLATLRFQRVDQLPPVRGDDRPLVRVLRGSPSRRRRRGPAARRASPAPGSCPRSCLRTSSGDVRTPSRSSTVGITSMLLTRSATTVPPAGPAGVMTADVDQLVVQGEPVVEAAVFVQLGPVVRGQHEQRPVGQPELVELGQELAGTARRPAGSSRRTPPARTARRRRAGSACPRSSPSSRSTSCSCSDPLYRRS